MHENVLAAGQEASHLGGEPDVHQGRPSAAMAPILRAPQSDQGHGGLTMNIWVAVTDSDWFKFLRTRQPEEVNFWAAGQGSGNSSRAICSCSSCTALTMPLPVVDSSCAVRPCRSGLRGRRSGRGTASAHSPTIGGGSRSTVVPSHQPPPKLTAMSPRIRFFGL